MSVNPTLQKYTSRLGDGGPDAGVTSDAEGTEDLGAFGFLRGTRDKADFLELRRKTGNIRAVGYSWIDKVDYDPSSGITIYFGTETIKITGRNLNTVARQQVSLLGAILRHRAPWIMESDQSGMLQADKQSVVV